MATAPSSYSESFPSRASMEVDSPSAHTPALTSSRNDTPLHDTPTSSSFHHPVQEDNDKDFVIEPTPATALAALEAAEVMAEHDSDDEVVSPYSKRKRSSINYNLDDLVDGPTSPSNIAGDMKAAKKLKPNKEPRGVVIGVWRDSEMPDDEDKHAIYGFIDVHDRMRTRIYAVNKRGEELISNMPTGAGGCWVTFPRVIFESHLQDLSPATIKEYVKIRTDAREATAEEKREAELQAVERAIAIVAAQEDTSVINNKPVGPRPAASRLSTSSRHSLPRQPLNSTPTFKAINSNFATPKLSPAGEKRISVLVGYWRDSDQVRLEDKHAAFGVLGNTDSFRVKVARLTRDGRHVDGNFPIGAGAIWLHYDKVVFEPHLVDLSRAEMKEYVRARQAQLEAGELDADREAHEMQAVEAAKEIVAAGGMQNGVEQPAPEVEIRHSARSEHRTQARQQAEAEAAAERQRKERAVMKERQNEQTRKDVAIAEAAAQEAAQAELKHNIKKLNKVWVAQQAATVPSVGTPSVPGTLQSTPIPINQEVKYHNGIKYERKQNGPFQGKLVSPAQILSIDGEDYVEYRVLTKPSFF